MGGAVGLVSARDFELNEIARLHRIWSDTAILGRYGGGPAVCRANLHTASGGLMSWRANLLADH